MNTRRFVLWGVVLALTLAAPAFAHHGAEDEALTPAPVETPEGSAAPGTTDADAPEDDSASAIRNADRLSAQNRLARALATANVWLVMLSFLGFGALLAVTPSGWSMIPILASILIDNGDRLTTQHAFKLSLIYVLAMAATFAAAGAAVSSLGINLQIPFQNAWVVSGVAALFALLSLSMFGFYTLRIPPALRSRLSRLGNQPHSGAYLGVAIMGVASAFIVAPVAAGPLANGLVYIGQSANALIGGSALFALSLAMGMPALLVGTCAARLLPRAASWMTALKAVFGVLLIAVAIYLLERILPKPATLLLCAGLLVVCAIYMGALEVVPRGASGWRRLWKGAGLVMLTYGVLLMVGVAGGGGDLLQPLRGVGL